MATRFYFPETLAAPVTPPTPSGGAEWEHNNNVTRALLLTPDGSTLTTTAYTPDAADDLTNRDACHRQYVSDPLGLQALSGNVKAQFQVLEAHANNELRLTFKILVCSYDGSTTRATLLAITRGTNEANTSLRNLTFQSTALSSYTTVNPGDRLVVEIGLGGNVTTAAGGVQGHNGSIRFGCSAAGGDLPENETDTGTTLRGWLEISTNIEFSLPPGITMAPRMTPERRP